MTTLLAILAAAAVGFGIATLLRLPVVPFLVLAGLCLPLIDDLSTRLGYEYIDPVSDKEMLEDVLVLGLTFLVFAAGMELNPMRVGQQRKAAIVVGVAQFLVMFVIGVGASVLLGLSAMAALHLGLAISASSTIVVVRILRNRRQFFEPFGRLVLGVLLLQDVMIIVLIAALSGAEHGLGGLTLTTLATLGLVLLAWICVKWISPWLILTLELDEESLLLVVLAILFAFTGLAFWMDVPLVVGSFFAGVALSGFPVNGVVRGQLISLSNFFLAIFFVSLGAILVMPTPAQFALVLVMVLLILIVTPLLVIVVAERLGVSARSSIESGLLLAQSSEFSIIVALLGVSAGYLEEGMLSVIALFTVVSMILTSLISTDAVTWQLLRWHPFGRRKLIDEDVSDHIVMIGCGSNSRVLLDLLLLHGNRVIVVDEDPGVVEALCARGVEAVRGDGADENVLRSFNAHKAHVVISTMRRIEDNERMLSIVGDRTVLVRVFGEEEAQRIEERGGIPIREADAAAKDFLEWFQERFGSGEAAGITGNRH